MAETYQDREVVGLDREGRVVQWNAAEGKPYSSGVALADWGIHNLREQEIDRVGVSREQWVAAAAQQVKLAADKDQVAIGTRVFAWIGAKQGLVPVQVMADITDADRGNHMPRLLSEKILEVRHLAGPYKGQCVPCNERHLYNKIPSESQRADRVAFFERLHEAASRSMHRNTDGRHP